MKHIPISYVFSTDKSELKEFLGNENLSQVCYIDEDKSKDIIVEKCYKGEDESECVRKNINEQKCKYNEAEYE